jgi:hypothetical protein
LADQCRGKKRRTRAGRRAASGPARSVDNEQGPKPLEPPGQEWSVNRAEFVIGLVRRQGRLGRTSDIKVYVSYRLGADVGTRDGPMGPVERETREPVQR